MVGGRLFTTGGFGRYVTLSARIRVTKGWTARWILGGMAGYMKELGFNPPPDVQRKGTKQGDPATRVTEKVI